MAITVPTDISNCVAWYDADDAGSFTYSGGVSVSTWNDKSGGGKHLDAPSSGDEPDRNATINGRSAVNFDGAAWIGDLSGWTTLTQPYTIIAVIQSDEPQVAHLISPQFLRHSGVTSDGICFQAGSLVGYGGYPDTQAQLIFGEFDGAGSVQRIDGSAVGTSNTGTDSMSIMRLGDPGGKPVMTVAEVVVYSRALSGGEITDIEAYLTARWLAAAATKAPVTSSNLRRNTLIRR